MILAYNDIAKEKAEVFKKKHSPILLAIESSCDETAAAILKGSRSVLSTSVHTQIPIHQKYGGVVPEIASRSHVERIGSVVSSALENADVTLNDIDAIAVTYGPGLVGALLVGVNYAKGLALSKKIPLVGVNHLAGHIAANYISHEELEPPFVCLVASGGHSHIVLVKDYNTFELIGRTRDDAAGEAFDKAARVLGLGYPGGPLLEKLALDGDKTKYKFNAGFNSRDIFDFSFSGVKTAVINLIHNAEQKGEEINKADVAASFQHTVVMTLAEKSVRAALKSGTGKLALAGGVSANKALRSEMERLSQKSGIKFYCPEFKYCTDNAAMIGCAGYYAVMDGRLDDLSLNADPSLSL